MKILNLLFLLFMLTIQGSYAFDGRFIESGRNAVNFGYNYFVPCSIKRQISPAIGAYGIMRPFTRSNNTAPIYQPTINSSITSNQNAYISNYGESIPSSQEEAIIIYDPEFTE